MRASTAATSWPTGTAAQVMASKQSLTGAYLSRPPRDPGARPAHPRRRLVRRATARPSTTSRTIDVELPVGKLDLRHRRVRLGQEHAGQRGHLQGAGQPRHAHAREAGRPPRGARVRGVRQGDRHRPVADRPHAALEPGHLHRPVRPHPRAVRADARAAGPRLQGRPLLVQRQGRPLRDLPRRRHHQDRDALPARRVHQLRGLPRPPLQPRDARGASSRASRSPTCWTCRSRRRSSSSPRSRSCAGGCRRCTTSASTTCGWASRPRPCRAARRSA